MGSRWPKELGDSFQKASLAFQAKNHEVAVKLLKALAISLGYEEDTFAEVGLTLWVQKLAIGSAQDCVRTVHAGFCSFVREPSSPLPCIMNLRWVSCFCSISTLILKKTPGKTPVYILYTQTSHACGAQQAAFYQSAVHTYHLSEMCETWSETALQLTTTGRSWPGKFTQEPGSFSILTQVRSCCICKIAVAVCWPGTSTLLWMNQQPRGPPDCMLMRTWTLSPCFISAQVCRSSQQRRYQDA